MSSTETTSLLEKLLAMQKLASELQVFLIVSSIFIGSVLWDFVQVSFDEAKYIFIPELRKSIKQRKLPTLPTISLLAIRLLTIPMMTLLLICLSSNAITAPLKVTLCKVYLYLQTTAGFFAMAIFVLRTTAIREAKLPLKVILWAYLLAIVAYGYAVIVMAQIPDDIYSIQTLIGATDEEIEQSVHDMLRSWTTLLSLIIAFDVAVFLLCLETRINKFRWVSSRSQVARTFYLDAFWYFGVTASVACLELAWIHINTDSRLYIALVIPIQSWVTITISPRVIRRLKLYVAKQEYQNDREPKAHHAAASPDSTKTHFSSAQAPVSTLSQQSSANSSNNEMENTTAPDGIPFHSVVVTLRSPPASSEEFQARRTWDRSTLPAPVSYP